MDRIKVAVLVISYNHGRFIEQCLDSIISQKTQGLFSLEIIIADDASDDQSHNIFLAYQTSSSVPIRILESSCRGGVRDNVLKLLSVSGYNYLALIDGDDYWSNESKVLNQVQFLEENEDYIGSCHDATIKHEDEFSKNALFGAFRSYSQAYSYSQDLFPWDVLGRDIIPTSSIVIRQKALDKINAAWVDDDYSIAWKLTLFMIKNSKMRYFNEAWSVYRNHSKGVSKSNNQGFHESHIRFLKMLMTDDKYQYLKLHIYKALVQEYTVLIPLLTSSHGHAPFFILFDYLRCEMKRVYLTLRMLTKAK